jgi:hypothetical protein
MRKLFIVLLFLLLLPNILIASGNLRKGLVSSIGAGIAPFAYWERDSIPVDNTSVGYGLSFSLGYGFDNQNEILVNINFFIVGSQLPDLADNYFQGLNSIQWRHYFSPEQPCFFTSVGAGIRIFGIYRKSDTASSIEGNRGFGYQVGFGYQFHNYLQAGLYYSGGKTSCNDIHYQHHVVFILAELIVF